MIHSPRVRQRGRGPVGMYALTALALAAGCMGSIEDAHDPRGARNGLPDAPGGAGAGPTTMPPGGGGSTGAMMEPGPRPACALAPRRIWRLTPDQYGRSVQAVLPGVTEAGKAIAA